METFLLALIPLFVAIDVFGVLPLFVGIREGMGGDQRGKLTIQATMTAFVISVVFLVAGKLLFAFLGITESDFRVGGGIVLLVLAVNDLLFSADTKRVPEPTTGVVPLGIPLIMGPAALRSPGLTHRRSSAGADLQYTPSCSRERRINLWIWVFVAVWR